MNQDYKETDLPVNSLKQTTSNLFIYLFRGLIKYCLDYAAGQKMLRLTTLLVFVSRLLIFFVLKRKNPNPYFFLK